MGGLNEPNDDWSQAPEAPTTLTEAVEEAAEFGLVLEHAQNGVLHDWDRVCRQEESGGMSGTGITFHADGKWQVGLPRTKEAYVGGETNLLVKYPTLKDAIDALKRAEEEFYKSGADELEKTHKREGKAGTKTGYIWVPREEAA